MNLFERYLTLWVLLCVVAGIALGQIAPEPFREIGRMEVARVNIPVGLLIWVMIGCQTRPTDFLSLANIPI